MKFARNNLFLIDDNKKFISSLQLPAQEHNYKIEYRLWTAKI